MSDTILRALHAVARIYSASQTELAASEAEVLKLKGDFESQLDICIWAKTIPITMVADRIAFGITVPHMPSIAQEVNFRLVPGSDVVEGATVVTRAVSKRRARQTGGTVKNGNLEVASTRSSSSSNGLPASGSMYLCAQQLSEMLFCKHRGLLASGRGSIAVRVAAVGSYADIPAAMQDIERTVRGAYDLIGGVNALWEQCECAVARGPDGADTAVLEIVVAAQEREVSSDMLRLVCTIALDQASITAVAAHIKLQRKDGQLTDAAAQQAVSNSPHCQETGFLRATGAIQAARDLLQLEA